MFLKIYAIASYRNLNQHHKSNVFAVNDYTLAIAHQFSRARHSGDIVRSKMRVESETKWCMPRFLVYSFEEYPTLCICT